MLFESKLVQIRVTAGVLSYNRKNFMFDKVGNPFICALTKPETFQTATGCRTVLQFEQHF